MTIAHLLPGTFKQEKLEVPRSDLSIYTLSGLGAFFDPFGQWDLDNCSKHAEVKLDDSFPPVFSGKMSTKLPSVCSCC